MDTAELDNSLREMMEKGFDDSFAAFCAKTYSSYEYPPENLVAAKMHAFFLRMALETLSDPVSREKLFDSNEDEGDERLLKVFRTVAKESYRAALSSGRPFSAIFVEKWCGSFAKK